MISLYGICFTCRWRFLSSVIELRSSVLVVVETRLIPLIGSIDPFIFRSCWWQIKLSRGFQALPESVLPVLSVDLPTSRSPDSSYKKFITSGATSVWFVLIVLLNVLMIWLIGACVRCCVFLLLCGVSCSLNRLMSFFSHAVPTHYSHSFVRLFLFFGSSFPIDLSGIPLWLDLTYNFISGWRTIYVRLSAV